MGRIPRLTEIEVRAPGWCTLIILGIGGFVGGAVVAPGGGRLGNGQPLPDAYWVSAAGLVVLVVGIVGLVINLVRRSRGR